MNSSAISSPNPSLIGGTFHRNPKKGIKSSIRAQTPPSNLVQFKPLGSTVPVNRGNYYKNGVSCKRNRLYAVNQEQEAQISREKEAPGGGGGGPSTSLLSFLCPLLKLFSVSACDWNDIIYTLVVEISSFFEFGLCYKFIVELGWINMSNVLERFFWVWYDLAIAYSLSSSI